MCRLTLPYNLVAEVFAAEDGVEDDLQVVAGGRVAVEVEAAGRLEHPVQFDQARRHHHQVRHHLVRADDLAQRAHRRRHARQSFLYQFVIGALRRFAPMPRILEGGDLGVALLPALVFEQHVVGSAAVEGRIEVNQVNAFVGEVVALAQNVEVVAVVQSVGGHAGLLPNESSHSFDYSAGRTTCPAHPAPNWLFALDAPARHTSPGATNPVRTRAYAKRCAKSQTMIARKDRCRLHGKASPFV